MGVHPMNCKDVRNQIIDQLHLCRHSSSFSVSTSSFRLNQSMVEHLQSCPDCARYLEETKQALAVIAPTHTIQASPSFRERVMNEIITQSINERKSGKAHWSSYALRPVFIGGLVIFMLFSLLLLDVWEPWKPNGPGRYQAVQLLAQAWANEAKWFEEQGIIHMTNEIVVPPIDDPILSQLRWYPMVALDQNGKIHMNQLQLSAETGAGYSVLDEVWFEPSSKRFIRILSLYGKAIFVTSYDGQRVYSIESDEQGKRNIVSHAVTESFQAPLDPTGLLGFAPGLKAQIDQQSEVFPIEFVGESELEDGTPVQLFKLTPQQLDTTADNAMIYKIDKNDVTVAEIEWRLNGKSILRIRRMSKETVLEPAIPWNLDGIEVDDTLTPRKMQPSVMSDVILMNVSIDHIMERATFPVYLLDNNPPWVQDCTHADLLDVTSPPKRMFMSVYRANDMRHVVLIQSETFNQTIGTQAKTGTLVYVSPNGCKAWSTPQGNTMATIILQSVFSVTKQKPADKPTSYVLETPDETFPCLAINGSLTEEELHALVDSLSTAKSPQK